MGGFVRATLSNATLAGSYNRVSFRGVDLRYAVVTGGLQNCDFSNAPNGQRSLFDNADLSQATMLFEPGGGSLAGASLVQTRLSSRTFYRLVAWQVPSGTFTGVHFEADRAESAHVAATLARAGSERHVPSTGWTCAALTCRRPTASRSP